MKAIFPGSFDPIHIGHINIIKKAAILFEKLYVVVSNNLEKHNQSAIDQRYQQVLTVCLELGSNIIVIQNDKLLTSELAKEMDAQYIVRGLRNNNDLKYEMELAFANKTLNPALETLFFIADYGLSEISSTFQRQIKQFKK